MNADMPPLPSEEELAAMERLVERGFIKITCGELPPGYQPRDGVERALTALPALLRAARELAELRAHGGPWLELDAARADLASLRSIASALADDVRVLARAGGVTAVSALEHVERWYEWTEAHRRGREGEQVSEPLWCPACGEGVAGDEDGCCMHCGATIISPDVLEEIRDADREAHAGTRAELDAARAEAARLRDLIRELLVDQAYGHKTIIPTCMCRWCRARALAAPPPAAAPQPEPARAQPEPETAAPERCSPDFEGIGLSGECMHVAGKRFWDKQSAPPPRPELTPEEVEAVRAMIRDHAGGGYLEEPHNASVIACRAALGPQPPPARGEKEE